MTTSTIYTNLPEYSYFTVSGDKSLHFLQGQLSCDVNLLNDKQVIFGAYLNIKGRVIATVRVIKLNEQILLQIPSSLADTVITRLSRIAQLSRVSIAPLSSIETVESIEKLIFSGSSREHWLQHLIQIKLVEITQETTELFTVHDINLPAHEAVSFTKGCYVGQEIVARMQYLGKLKQGLQYLKWPTPPICLNGAQLFDENSAPAGQIALSCILENTQHALVVLKDSAMGKKLYTEQREHLSYTARN
ncbi:MAG: hypothetical protein K5Q00_02235 [Gammaproteobacteria bacterium]|nr:hypothetical protein [Gammaproteobacteria bacterium]